MNARHSTTLSDIEADTVQIAAQSSPPRIGILRLLIGETPRWANQSETDAAE